MKKLILYYTIAKAEVTYQLSIVNMTFENSDVFEQNDLINKIYKGGQICLI